MVPGAHEKVRFLFHGASSPYLAVDKDCYIKNSETVGSNPEAGTIGINMVDEPEALGLRL